MLEPEDQEGFADNEAFEKHFLNYVTVQKVLREYSLFLRLLVMKVFISGKNGTVIISIHRAFKEHRVDHRCISEQVLLIINWQRRHLYLF